MDDIIGRSVLEWTAPDEQAHNAEAVAQCAQQGFVQDFETVYLDKNGTRIDILINATVRETPQGKRLISLCRNITERKRAELRLRKINDVLLQLGADRDINIDRLTTLCGELMGADCALYNRLRHHMLCALGQWRTPPDFKPEDTPDGHICYDVISHNATDAYVVRNLQTSAYAATDPNVRAFGLQTYAGRVVRRRGAPVGSLCVVYGRDVELTPEDFNVLGIIAAALGAEEDRSHAEDELHQTQVMLVQAEKMAALGQMASGLAHEVKNPLDIIMQGVDFIAHELPSDAPQLHGVIGKIKKAITRADAIVQNLLEFARKTPSDIKAYSLNTIVEESLDALESHPALSKVDVRLELAPALPQVMVDGHHLTQVLINLLSNALKAMPSGGTLTVRTREEHIAHVGNHVGRRKTDRFRIGDVAVVCEIEDTGSGISKKNLGRIFDPFFTTAAPGEGTGLGLAITKSLVEINGGMIHIDSEEGKGTKARIVLPLAPREDTPHG